MEKEIKTLFPEDYAFIKVFYSEEEHTIIFRYYDYNSICEIILEREEKFPL